MCKKTMILIDSPHDLNDLVGVWATREDY